MAKLFRPFPHPVPSRPRRLDEGDDAAAQRIRYLHDGLAHRGFGRFIANLYDGRSNFFPNENSKRWRLVQQAASADQIYNGVYYRETLTKERGHWVEIPQEDEVKAGEGEYSDPMPVPFGRDTYVNLNARFFTGVTGDAWDHPEAFKIPKPVQIITAATWGNNVQELSTIQNSVETPMDGFVKAPPPSHVLDPDENSLTHGQWIDPVGAEYVQAKDGGLTYFSNSSKLTVKLKHGLNWIRLWCPSGEYREFDTSDRTNFKITREPSFDAPEVSLPIKIGRGMATQWDMFLMPRRTMIQSHWWDYYFVQAGFVSFVWGFHNIRNLLDRLPLFPVPYGHAGGEFDDVFPVDDWTYYVSRWHGGFSPPITNQHTRPIGFQDAGGEEAFDPTKLPDAHLWEGDPAHGSDYSIEYAIKHGTLVKHDPLAFAASNPFFAIVYTHSSDIGYFVRIALQQPGDLCCKIRPKRRDGVSEGQWFYVWSRTQYTISPIRTLNSGLFHYDWLNPSGDPYQLSAALQIAGYA